MGSSEEPTEAPAASMLSPAVRASDAERERTASALRDHTVAGRITPEELSERLDAAYGAVTVAELEQLTHDLPPSGADPQRAIGAAPSPRRDLALRRVMHAVGYVVLLNAASVSVWLASGTAGSFWPKWVLLVSAIRLAFVAWSQLGPGAEEETRLGRGGARAIQRGEER